jgi:site-specific recombinase XerC
VAAQLVPTNSPRLLSPNSWESDLETFLNAISNSPNTTVVYRRYCRRACAWLGIRSLSELDGTVLAEYRAFVVANRSLAPNTRILMLAAFRSFLSWSWMVGAHQLDERTLRLCLKAPRGSVRRPYAVVSPDGQRALWESAAGRPADVALLCVCLGAGLRRAEIAALKVSDCYEDLGGGPALYVREGKGGKDRVVPVNRAYFAGIAGYLKATGRTLQSAGPLFLSTESGAPKGVLPKAIATRLKRITVRAGVGRPRLAVHSMRHTYALAILRNSGSVAAAQKLLGHSNVSTTMRYLDHLEMGDLREAAPSPVGIP